MRGKSITKDPKWHQKHTLKISWHFHLGQSESKKSLEGERFFLLLSCPFVLDDVMLGEPGAVLMAR